MAGKGRRAASRQGELSRRRKKGARGPSGIPATSARDHQQNGGEAAVAVGTVADAEAPVNVEGPANAVQQAQPAVAAASARPSAQTVAQPRGQGRQRGERPAAYNYIGAELRRIAVLSTAVLAALVALSFVI